MFKTCLYAHHVALGAKIVPFAGWEMPLQYEGILTEHRTVREKVGLFDLSHMGRIDLQGPGTLQLLDALSTNKVAQLPPFSSLYTPWCHASGGTLDDLLIYCRSKENFFIIANAANREKDLIHLQSHALKQPIQIRARYTDFGILALQGPLAAPLLHLIEPASASLKPMHFLETSGNKHPSIEISRTGYTGAGGFELYGNQEAILHWWELLLKEGRPFGLKAIGLGARDTLRLEMGFALYGHELSESIAPTESVARWAVHLEKATFLGKEALLTLEQNPSKRYAYGMLMQDKSIARAACFVLKEGKKIGSVTSGSFSPTLSLGIALILTDRPLKKGDNVQVEIRNALHPATIASLPFVPNQKSLI